MIWIPTKEKLFGMSCLCHEVTKELCVFGSKGELYVYDDKTIGVLINSGHNKLIKSLSSLIGIVPPKLRNGEQYVFKMPLKHLHELKKLFLIKTPVRQMSYAAKT